MSKKNSSDGAGHAEHPKWMQHHFDTPSQQFASSKMGMWLFLATEVLLFAGLFCAYTVYRANHMEMFIFGHQFLDVKWGAINTCVLLFSSLTAAWSVRAAQLGQKGLMILLLFLTMACGGGFMAIKYVEYSHKIHDGLLWGTKYKPTGHAAELIHGEAAHGAGDAGGAHGTVDAGHAEADAAAAIETAHGEEAADDAHAADGADAMETSAHAPELPANVLALDAAERSSTQPAAIGPRGMVPVSDTEHAEAGGHHWEGPIPDNVHIFFGIYFGMTGLHGIHVLIGMIILGWLIYRALKNDFSPEYFTPVDLGVLYWHLVDLIWIFLFPLLYLIG